MTEYGPAFEEIRASYDDETLKKIKEKGCASGAAEKHNDLTQIIRLFDENDYEIKELIDDSEGGEFTSELWWNNTCNIDGYKKDMITFTPIGSGF